MRSKTGLVGNVGVSPRQVEKLGLGATWKRGWKKELDKQVMGM